MILKVIVFNIYKHSKFDAVPNSLQFFYFGTFATVQTLHATSVQRYTFFATNLG